MKSYIERCNKTLSLLSYVTKDGDRKITCVYPDSGTARAATRALINEGYVDSAVPQSDNQITFTVLQKRQIQHRIVNYKTWVTQNDSPEFRMNIIRFVLHRGFNINPSPVDPETGCRKRIKFQNDTDLSKAIETFRQLGFRTFTTENLETKFKYSLYVSLLKKVDGFVGTQNASGNTILSEIKRAGGMRHHLSDELCRQQEKQISGNNTDDLDYDGIAKKVHIALKEALESLGRKRTGLNFTVQKNERKKGRFRISINDAQRRLTDKESKKSLFDDLVEKLPEDIKQYLNSTGATLGFQLPNEGNEQNPEKQFEIGTKEYFLNILNKNTKRKLGITAIRYTGTENGSGYLRFYLNSKEKKLINFDSIKNLLPKEVKSHLMKLQGTQIYFTSKINETSQEEILIPNEDHISDKPVAVDAISLDATSSKTKEGAENELTVAPDLTEHIIHINQKNNSLPNLPIRDVELSADQFRELFDSIPEAILNVLIAERIGEIENLIEEVTFRFAGMNSPITLSEGQFKVKLKPLI